jgi:alcohol dehydrogenase (cytochrome c)
VAVAGAQSGAQLFEQACVVCHGSDGRGGHGGGAPLDGVVDLAVAVATVTGGRNNMPAFASVFTPEQIRDVSAYVVEALAARPAD